MLQHECNRSEIAGQTPEATKPVMNYRVRQVPSQGAGGFGLPASPAAPASHQPAPWATGNAVRHATAKAPDGAGTTDAAGHVVAPALPVGGPGFYRTTLISVGSSSLLQGESAVGGPRNVTSRCYAAPQDALCPVAERSNRSARYFLPASDQGTRLLDRIRGDRLRQVALCHAAGTRGGFGRDVSLSFEPAPQLSARIQSGEAVPRIRSRIVAKAQP